jgi:hypothetical protein
MAAPIRESAQLRFLIKMASHNVKKNVFASPLSLVRIASAQATAAP